MQYKLARRAKLIEKIGRSLFATIEYRLMEVFKLNWLVDSFEWGF